MKSPYVTFWQFYLAECPIDSISTYINTIASSNQLDWGSDPIVRIDLALEKQLDQAEQSGVNDEDFRWTIDFSNILDSWLLDVTVGLCNVNVELSDRDIHGLQPALCLESVPADGSNMTLVLYARTTPPESNDTMNRLVENVPLFKTRRRPDSKGTLFGGPVWQYENLKWEGMNVPQAIAWVDTRDSLPQDDTDLRKVFYYLKELCYFRIQILNLIELSKSYGTRIETYSHKLNELQVRLGASTREPDLSYWDALNYNPHITRQKLLRDLEGYFTEHLEILKGITDLKRQIDSHYIDIKRQDLNYQRRLNYLAAELPDDNLNFARAFSNSVRDSFLPQAEVYIRNITSIQEMGDRQIDIARGFLEAARIQETDTSQRLFVAIGAGVGIASVISSIGSALIKDINPSVSPINNLFVVLVYSIVFGLMLPLASLYLVRGKSRK